MADMLSDGASWLVAQLSANAAQTVTLKRGGKSTTGVKATKAPARSTSDPLNNEGYLSSDWIVAASQYVIDGAVVEPQKNDVIEEASGQQWSVLPLTAKDEAQPFDPFGNGWRIHSKRIKDAT